MKFYVPEIVTDINVSGKFIPTGLPIIDNALNDLEPSSLTVLSGRSNEGKTTIVKQIIANAIDGGFKVCVINAEEKSLYFHNDIWRKVIGNDKKYYNVKQVNKKYVRLPTEESKAMLEEWIKGKLTIGETEELMSIENLFQTMEKQLTDGNHDILIIDNLMALLNAKQSEKFAQQGEFVERCKLLCRKTGKHVLLVVHPSKEYRPDSKPVMEHISGASEIYAKADNVLFVTRTDRPEDIANWVNGRMYILKCRYYSTREICELNYDENTSMLCQIKAGAITRYKFKIGDYTRADESIQMPFDL